MTPKANAASPIPPSISDMTARYLLRQVTAREAGFAPAEAGEVVPFEAGPVPPIDPRTAWQEGCTALRLYSTKKSDPDVQPPLDWSTLVAGQEPVTALALAAGNFPQMVRDLHQFWRASDLTVLRPPIHRATPLPHAAEQTSAAGSDWPHRFLSLGLFRLSGNFERAVEFVRTHEAQVPPHWVAGWQNERAALLWHQGRGDEAAALWDAQAESVPVLFNRGMAALFLGRAPAALEPLRKAVEQLPDDGAWHHLGRLYLALAEMRG